MLTLAIVNSTVRPSFNWNVTFVDKYLVGSGLDMGCGSCPLLKDNCYHFDISPQPIAEEQVPDFYQVDVTTFRIAGEFDYIFSSHMLEDLSCREGMLQCIEHWMFMLKPGGHIVLLIPDMQGGRYPTVEEGGNCSHQTNVGLPFFVDLVKDIPSLCIVQSDTIPHERSETMDIVFRKEE